MDAQLTTLLKGLLVEGIKLLRKLNELTERELNEKG